MAWDEVAEEDVGCEGFGADLCAEGEVPETCSAEGEGGCGGGEEGGGWVGGSRRGCRWRVIV